MINAYPATEFLWLLIPGLVLAVVIASAVRRSGLLTEQRVKRVKQESGGSAGPPVPGVNMAISPAVRRMLPGGWLVIDCETTGLGRDDRIVTLAIIVVLNGVPSQDVIYTIFNPNRPSHPRAAEIHGWSDDVLLRQDQFADHAPHILHLLSVARGVIGHHVAFDIDMLRREFDALGLVMPRLTAICTRDLSRETWPRAKADLDSVARRLGLARRGRTHNPVQDAWLSLQVLYCLSDYPAPPEIVLPSLPFNFKD